MDKLLALGATKAEAAQIDQLISDDNDEFYNDGFDDGYDRIKPTEGTAR